MRIRISSLLRPNTHFHTFPRVLQPHRNASSTTVAVGTSYERLTALTLQCLCFSLTHVGGRSDRGIDLQGYWSPPETHGKPPHENDGQSEPKQSHLRIPVIVQCKAHITRPKPEWIRELQGAMDSAPIQLGDNVMGVLVSKGKVTSGVREAVMAAKRGVMWVQMEEFEDGKGRVEQCLWNGEVQRRVGDGLSTGFVYAPGLGGQPVREMRLLLQGRIWSSVTDLSDALLV